MPTTATPNPLTSYNRDKFFSTVRYLPYQNRLPQVAVDGMNAILLAWDNWVVTNAHLQPNIRWLAYCLATAYREAGPDMQPVREIGEGYGEEYGLPDPATGLVYYGRGLVQLTWKANYAKLGALLHLDLVNKPDLALVPANAAAIMFYGMALGLFTGKSLPQYFGANKAKDNAFGAREIINGTNMAQLVATYHADFVRALS